MRRSWLGVLLLTTSCSPAGVTPPCSTPEILINTDLTFVMGGDPKCTEDRAPTCGNRSDVESDDWTIPEHVVTLEPYFMDQTEVTNIQYKQCVDDGVCKPPLDCNQVMPLSTFVYGCKYEQRVYDNLPVVAVTWDNAKAYCSYRGGRSLPTEAQWERAAVGPRNPGETARRFPWGDEPPTENQAHLEEHAKCGTALREQMGAEVRSLKRAAGRSREGIYDLAGNVREWVQDDFTSNVYCQNSGRSTETRTPRPNECAGKECNRTVPAPGTSSTGVAHVVADGNPDFLKVVRGGAFCDTTAGRRRHDCDVTTRARMPLRKDLVIPETKDFSQVTGFANDAQVTGFRCARRVTQDAQPLPAPVCNSGDVTVREYSQPDAGAGLSSSSAAASSSSAGASSSAASSSGSHASSAASSASSSSSHASGSSST